MSSVRLAKDVLIPRRDIIGIFDMDTSTVSGVTREFIKYWQKQGNITALDSGIPRSFLLTRRGVYISSRSVKILAAKIGVASIPTMNAIRIADSL